MSIDNARIIAVVGGLLLALGLFLGFQQLEHFSTPCGSAFSENVDLEAMPYFYDDADRAYCGDETGDRRLLAGGIVVLGLAGVGAGLYGIKRHEDATRAARPEKARNAPARRLAGGGVVVFGVERVALSGHYRSRPQTRDERLRRAVPEPAVRPVATGARSRDVGAVDLGGDQPPL